MTTPQSGQSRKQDPCTSSLKAADIMKGALRGVLRPGLWQ